MARSVGFLAVISLAALTLISQVNADCKNFTQTRDYYTTTAGGIQAISRGFICDTPSSVYLYPNQMRCNASSQCTVYGGGIVNGQGYTNISSISMDDTLKLYELIPTQTRSTPPFLYSLSTNVGNLSTCVDAAPRNMSRSGYYAFTPFLLCTEGILSSCSNGPVDDGTAVKICAVDTYGNTNPNLNGQSTFVISNDFAALENMTTNPGATRSPVAALPKDQAKKDGVVDISSSTKAVALRTSIWVALCLAVGANFIW